MEPERTPTTSDRESPPSSLWVRLSRHLVGDLTDREQATVDRWLAADPHRATAITALRTAWDQRTEPDTSVDVERALLTVTHHIALRDQRRSGAADKPSRPIVRRSEAWSLRRGASTGYFLPQIVRTVLNGLMDRAVIALFGPKDTRLTAAEIERVRHLVEEAETDDA